MLKVRGCELEIIVDQDPCKSDFKLLFFLMQIIFIYMLIEEYKIIFATL